MRQKEIAGSVIEGVELTMRELLNVFSKTWYKTDFSPGWRQI